MTTSNGIKIPVDYDGIAAIILIIGIVVLIALGRGEGLVSVLATASGYLFGTIRGANGSRQGTTQGKGQV